MRDLKPVSPLVDHAPLAVWPWRVIETPIDHLTAIHAFPGPRSALSGAMKAAHGMAWPDRGTSTGRTGNRLIWAGDGVAWLVGPPPLHKDIAPHAALFDETDGWVCLTFTGEGALAALDAGVRDDLAARVRRRGECCWLRGLGARALLHRRGAALDLYVPRTRAVALHAVLTRLLVRAAAMQRNSPDGVGAPPSSRGGPRTTP